MDSKARLYQSVVKMVQVRPSLITVLLVTMLNPPLNCIDSPIVRPSSSINKII